MERLVLTDAQWAKMGPHCLGKPTDPGRSGGDNRLFVEAVLWIARTGSPDNPSATTTLSTRRAASDSASSTGLRP